MHEEPGLMDSNDHPGYKLAVPTDRPTCLVLHQVDCAGSSPAHSRHPDGRLFLDRPRYHAGDNSADALRGTSPLHDVSAYLEDHPTVSFVVYRTYSCDEHHSLVFGNRGSTFRDASEFADDVFALLDDSVSAVPQREHMTLHNSSLKNAISALRSKRPELEPQLQGWERGHNLIAPYLHFYHVRHLLRDNRTCVETTQGQVLDILLEYLETNFGTEYEEADALFSKGFVTEKHFHKLFGPREVLATKDEGHYVAIAATHCPSPNSRMIQVRCDRWFFDGQFSKRTEEIVIQWPRHQYAAEDMMIDSLPIFPLRFNPDLHLRLRNRGDMFWSCRKRRLISYQALEFPESQRNGRYMIDLCSYHFLEGADCERHTRTDAESGIMQLEQPPFDDFNLLLPPTMIGYGFNDNRWRSLEVEYMCPVQWDYAAFDNVVLGQDETTMVFSSIGPEPRVSSRSNVLQTRHHSRITVFSGPSGAGKTFVANSVAERANVPLCRFSACDVLHAPKTTAKTTLLEKLSYISNVWQAVIVLQGIDEVANGEFLSFDGTMIIMTEEASAIHPRLKAQVHLSIRFPPLDVEARCKIWTACVKRAAEEIEHLLAPSDRIRSNPIDTELSKSIKEWSKKDLNGRQISNICRSAKTFAYIEQTTLQLRHISVIMNVEMAIRNSQ
ncbi:hypothetical protein F5Y15DRAFT_326459 [Xylariaceae sp. FL0016]|nr:hypothetical protein F5Y15DRAFT_326459 [Xylariaceae sp. FL0016]